jgi:hypothetical protein
MRKEKKTRHCLQAVACEAPPCYFLPVLVQSDRPSVTQETARGMNTQNAIFSPLFCCLIIAGPRRRRRSGVLSLSGQIQYALKL